MTSPLTADVAIAGAGPVGLTLALDLASRGVQVVVIEQRRAEELPSVKCNHVASRTMEAFRRLGIAAEIRSAGLPDDYPNDVVVRTRATGHELTRIPIPCRQRRFTATEGPDTNWPTPEPPHRVNQIYFEPILHRRAARTAGIRILNRTRYEDHVQLEDAVRVAVTDLDTNATSAIECRYFVGCDGPRSEVRRQIGAKLHGDDAIQRVQSSHIRAPTLASLITSPPAWMSYLYTPVRAGNLVAIDGHETWLIHNYLLRDEPDFESVDRDHCIRELLGVGSDFEYDLLACEDWVGRRLVANRFRDRRVFICGDAAHLWVPYAGYGMNAGIADAMNLSWMLAAHLKGWAHSSILDAYERERLPVNEQVSLYVAKHAAGAIAERTSVPAEIDDDTPEGAAARTRIGRGAYDLHVQQFACAGLNYGYCYASSPLIAYDHEEPPKWTMGDYTPSTVPGCRTPHVWLQDGRSLYDAMGPDYTLLVFDSDIDTSQITLAAAKRGVPLAVLQIESQGMQTPYHHKLVMSRPDRHIAWRSNTVPSDPLALIDLVTGR
jgi:2-polyprenyl-6-methoxyphenol hydroxylase-like FAD-dependent oxidoreductase